MSNGTEPEFTPDSAPLREKVEGWLNTQEPESLVMLADRFLVRTIVPHQELPKLLEKGPEMVEALGRASSEVVLVNDPASCFVLLWCLQENGLDVSNARIGLEAVLDFWEPMVNHALEPMRSVVRYWQWKVGFLNAFEPGPTPPGGLYRIYHQLHLIFYSGEYGRKRVDAQSVAGLRYDAHTSADRFRNNCDLLGELLLAEVILTPRNEYVIQHLIDELMALAHPDGRLTVPGGNLQTDHHAACVTSLALNLLQTEKPETLH